jgi:hypothetical protein
VKQFSHLVNQSRDDDQAHEEKEEKEAEGQSARRIRYADRPRKAPSSLTVAGSCPFTFWPNIEKGNSRRSPLGQAGLTAGKAPAINPASP